MAKHHAKKTDKTLAVENTAQSVEPVENSLQIENSEQENEVVKNEQAPPEPTKEEPMQPSPEKVTTDNEPAKPETVIVKKGGTGVAILALLVALGLGGAGYYFAEQHLTSVQARLTALEAQKPLSTHSQTFTDADLSALKQDQSKIAQLAQTSQSTNEKLIALEKMVEIKEQQISALQNQVNTLSNAKKAAQPNDWLLSEADFLLNNALRKLVLDNDVDTAISLLKVADETLSKVSDPRVINVRSAINSDLKQLLSVNNIDQNAIMQHLSQLANNVDELSVLNVNFDESNENNDKLSGSWDDWKENAEKSATSFLNHFIRITPKNADNKALLAPNQDIYLRENIRLRLQLAIMAVPRQQNDLYKQSLETVASWVRSYFDTNTEVVQTFLKEVDELAEQSIYVDVPTQLTSLNLLDKLLNKPSQEVQKIELSVDKEVAQENAQNAKGESAQGSNTTENAAPAQQASAVNAESNATQNDENRSEKPSENQTAVENQSAVENADKSEQNQAQQQ
ncbi:uroporphyrinogen-III C-methyltransferase [Avibacterium sp. 20-15]|uniref:uroporphyrinogen-III C-methyltransferase n=1 Tax=unclassified Avibacterium TaxID=2685287 RepID=UPI0020260B5F|nr:MULTISPECIES: uroporphyrinogen-III C-methyltransferase [unclassified Avibacterium]MCW9732741.1 uroporphyrinogen-III C-methyltransferase [Avibacterium sp. 20-15]URL04886.1 uroporphyrinogen-III C-methyltransferase [Avibacterium sp. 20-132]